MGFFEGDAPVAKVKRSRAQTGARAGVFDPTQRDDDNYYATPEEVTQALLDVERFEGGIWEPACGDGAISRVLEASGYKVLSSDLTYRGYGKKGSHDFLADRKTRVDNVITNPPFQLAEAFALQALAATRNKVALLSRIQFMEGQRRCEGLFKRSPIARVYVFARRVSMRRRNVETTPGIMAFAWFVWEHGHKGRTTLDWLI